MLRDSGIRKIPGDRGRFFGTPKKTIRSTRISSWPVRGSTANGRRPKGDSIGIIPFGGHETAREFRENIEAPFFRYYLHGQGEKPAWQASTFQSGSNTWRTYAAWPPKEAKPTNLYLHADGTLSFTAPDAAKTGQAYREYVSDPANPVPYRQRPISPTYPAGDWRTWEVADQRFVDRRPDVLSFVSEPLDHDLTVTGPLAANLFASTSGTDSDFVVKLIDVYPQDAQKNAWNPDEGPKPGQYAQSLNGYELPIAMEVRRGRYLASYEKPHPLTPNQPTEWNIPLRDHDHVFLKGHRIMVQIQSTWFPVIDRNPQKFVPSIYQATASDFVPRRSVSIVRRICLRISCCRSCPSIRRLRQKTQRPGRHFPGHVSHQRFFTLLSAGGPVLSQPRRQLRFLLRLQVDAVVDAFNGLFVSAFRRRDLVSGKELRHLIARSRHRRTRWSLPPLGRWQTARRPFSIAAQCWRMKSHASFSPAGFPSTLVISPSASCDRTSGRDGKFQRSLQQLLIAELGQREEVHVVLLRRLWISSGPPSPCRRTRSPRSRPPARRRRRPVHDRPTTDRPEPCPRSCVPAARVSGSRAS